MSSAKVIATCLARASHGNAVKRPKCNATYILCSKLLTACLLVALSAQLAESVCSCSGAVGGGQHR